VVEVLVEKEGRSEGHMMGRSRRNKVVVFPGGPELVGAYVDVVLERTTGATFVGTAVEVPVAAESA
jgi:tRNA A37 methylthiotransferase MiaB